MSVALLEAAAEATQWLQSQGYQACIIGGLAVIRWGELRLTQDVDLTLLAPFGSEEEIVDACLARFSARSADARQFALERRVLLLKAANGVELDLALGATDFEQGAIERASPYDFGSGYFLNTCSAEDLLVHKAVASRPRDLNDIQGILRRQGNTLDLAHVRRWLRIFEELMEGQDIADNFERIVSSVKRNRPADPLS